MVYEKHHASSSALPSSANIDADADALILIGKLPVLRRSFSRTAVLGLSCSLAITWEGTFSVFIFGLSNGGPAGLIYSFLVCWAGWACVVATMGEMVSMWPTAGGQYHWTYMLAPPRYRVLLSYVTGWQSVIAWQALAASASYLTATSIQGLVINSQEQYVPKAWHGTMMVIALAVVLWLFNTFLTRLLPHVEKAILWLHMALFVVVLVVITVLAPQKSSNDQVWTQFLSEGGYESKGLTFFIGWLTPVFAFAGADGAVHMSEEIRNSARVVPWALVMAILINGATGFAMLITILYCIGDTEAALTTKTGYPFIEIITQGVRSVGGGTALCACLVLMFCLATLGAVATASRQLWAFARDRAVPNAKFVGYVHPRLKVPVVALCITAIVTCLLSLINIGSATVFNAIVSLTVSGFFGSYLVPFCLLLYKRTRYPGILVPGPWTLGKWGPLVNSFAIVWGVLVMFFSFWPANVHVTAMNMNWSCVLWSSVMLFAFAFWFLHGKKVYTGPIIETDITEADAMRTR